MKPFYYIITLSSLLTICSCSKDLGNYNYQEINELTIKGVKSEYIVRTGLDTLVITPDISDKIDGTDPSRYSYYWIMKEGQNFYDTVSREKDLRYPIKLTAKDHDLFYRVLDKVTGVSWVANSKVKVSTPYSRGILIIGEDEEGYAEAEMLSMLPDTVYIPNILSKTSLPKLREPISMFHTSGTDTYSRLWVMTKTGSYFLDRALMTGTSNNNFGRLTFLSDDIDVSTLHPAVVAPQIREIKGSTGSTLYRAVVTTGGDIFATAAVLMGGDFYNNPVNRVIDGPDTRLPAAPYLLYPINSMNNFMWYDTKNQRFLSFTKIYVGTTSTVLIDNDKDVFPWNQPAGRTLIYAENTRNTDDGSTHGNSFAVMKDMDNTCQIYKFYANGTNPAKRGSYTVKSMATDFYKADHYAFSSNRSVIFYAVGNKLYAYDYNPGFEKIYEFPEIQDPITMLKFDTQIDHVTNSLYVATYNPGTKGTLSRYKVGTNPNVVELLSQENSRWSGMIKIKDINWRAIN